MRGLPWIIAAALGLVSLFLAACGDSKPGHALIGTWQSRDESRELLRFRPSGRVDSQNQWFYVSVPYFVDAEGLLVRRTFNVDHLQNVTWPHIKHRFKTTGKTLVLTRFAAEGTAETARTYERVTPTVFRWRPQDLGPEEVLARAASEEALPPPLEGGSK